MNGTWKRWSAAALLASLSLACGASPESVVEDDETARQREALNACDETVPADRVVDGIPAYAQCDAVSSGDIWSNDGVATSATSGGDGWIRTQRGGGYQCTELARRYLHFAWGIDYQHGNAQEWCDGELPQTLTLATTPVHGDLIVFEGGVCGAATSTGHIALIDEVDAEEARVTFIEQNRAGRRSSDIDCGKCFLHVVANDGSAGGSAGAGGAAGSAGMGGAGEGPTSGGTAGFGGEPVAAGGAGGGMEPARGGAAGAPEGGRAGSGVSVGVGGSSAGAAGSGLGGASAGAAGEASGGVGVAGVAGAPAGSGAQAGAAGAGGAPGGAGSAGGSSETSGDEAEGASCSAAPASARASGSAWLSALLAGVAFSLQRRSRAIRRRR